MDMKAIPTAAGGQLAWGDAAYCAALPEPAEELVGYGRWWLDSASAQILLSPTAARYLGVAPGVHSGAHACCLHVIAEDLAAMKGALAQALHGVAVDAVFRTIDPIDGLRWLRVLSAPAPEIFICYCERRITRSTGATTWCTCGREISPKEGSQRAILVLLEETNALM